MAGGPNKVKYGSVEDTLRRGGVPVYISVLILPLILIHPGGRGLSAGGTDEVARERGLMGSGIQHLPHAAALWLASCVASSHCCSN